MSPVLGESVPSRRRACARLDLPKTVIKVLKKHAAGLSPGDVCRKYGISDATFCKWRRFGEKEISDARKLKALEEDNRRLKKLAE